LASARAASVVGGRRLNMRAPVMWMRRRQLCRVCRADQGVLVVCSWRAKRLTHREIRPLLCPLVLLRHVQGAAAGADKPPVGGKLVTVPKGGKPAKPVKPPHLKHNM